MKLQCLLFSLTASEQSDSTAKEAAILPASGGDI